MFIRLRFYGCLFVDPVKHGVLTRVSEIPCCKNDHYYYYYCFSEAYQFSEFVGCIQGEREE